MLNTFNRFKKYKRAVSEAERKANRARDRREHPENYYVPKRPKGMIRLSDIKMTESNGFGADEFKKIKFNTPVYYMTYHIMEDTNNREGWGKWKGWTFYPYSGDYPTLKVGKKTFSLDEKKIFFKESDLKKFKVNYKKR